MGLLLPIEHYVAAIGVLAPISSFVSVSVLDS